ncbi:MAG: glycosyltransferase family 8 protein [Erysipelotrichales bacterium]|nr:glycosyltransferase family 8 protein [Erysipelotrichales bacterium]
MNIVFATSDLYANQAYITIFSLLEENIHMEEINIYYVENGMTEQNKKKLQKLVSQYKRSIEFISMREELKQISGLLRTNPVVYSYCYFQDILPNNVDKVLMLESDTMVTNKLDDFYNIDISDVYLAATDDLQSKWFKERLGINPNSPYFNSGVLLLNLKKMREDSISEKMTELITLGKSKYMYEVQDEMNILFEGCVKILPPKYNCTTSLFVFDYLDMKRYRKPSTCCSEEEFFEAINNPIVVHFTNNQIIQSRPWIENCDHPYCDRYNQYKEKSILKNEKLWKSNRKILNKIINYLYKNGFKSFIASSLGLIHAYFYPKILYKYILKR